MVGKIWPNFTSKQKDPTTRVIQLEPTQHKSELKFIHSTMILEQVIGRGRGLGVAGKAADMVPISTKNSFKELPLETKVIPAKIQEPQHMIEAQKLV